MNITLMVMYQVIETLVEVCSIGCGSLIDKEVL